MYLLIISISLFLTNVVFSQNPIVSSVSGKVNNDSLIIINGNNFGIKSTASPYKWDNFESGVDGDDLGGWYLTSNIAGMHPKYDDGRTRHANSSISALVDHTSGNYNCLMGIVGQDIVTMYFSGWFYNTVSGAESRNFKFLSLRSGPAGTMGEPEIRWDMYPVNPSGHMYMANTANQLIAQTYGLGGNTYPDGWHRVEVWLDQGTVDQSDGELYTWRDCQDWCSLTSVPVLTTQYPESYDNFYLGHYFASDVGSPLPEMELWWEDVYIDWTRARVEIGNDSAWNNCTHREIQIPTAWTSGSVSATVNTGTFLSGSTAYLFVVDENGNVSNGFPVEIGASSGVNIPSKPKKANVEAY
jgi:hypothetical protein